MKATSLRRLRKEILIGWGRPGGLPPTRWTPFFTVRQRWRAVDECVASLGVAAISDRGELVVGVRLVRQQCLI